MKEYKLNEETEMVTVDEPDCLMNFQYRNTFSSKAIEWLKDHYKKYNLDLNNEDSIDAMINSLENRFGFSSGYSCTLTVKNDNEEVKPITPLRHKLMHILCTEEYCLDQLGIYNIHKI